MAGHRWWRITNIISTGYDGYVDATLLEFVNDKNLKADDINKSLQNSRLQDNIGFDFTIFDKNGAGTMHSNSIQPSTAFVVGYVFDEPVNVVAIKIRMRSDLSWRKWQTADLQYSDDGIKWDKYASLEPRFASNDTDIKTILLALPTVVLGNSVQDDGKVSRFILIHNWLSGAFIEKITPDASGNWTYEQIGDTPVIVTHIGAEGYRPKTDAPIIPIAID